VQSGGALETAVIQSITGSVLPADAAEVLRVGDVVVSVNGASMRYMSYADQLHCIKNSNRPIIIGFAPQPRGMKGR
jgi:C-terminal processing protease CtpA/Prc